MRETQVDTAVSNDQPRVRSGAVYRVVSGVLAFLLWGGWALYVNLEFGEDIALKACLTQGTASFVITLFMVRSVEWLFGRLPPGTLQMTIPSVLTVSFTGSCLALTHWFMGTPRIFATIAPALTVAFLFCLFTTYKLKPEQP